MPPTTSDLRDLLAFALDLADEADRISMSYYRGELGTTEKADGSLVTRADKAVEAELRALIARRYPEHSVLGEEAGYTEGSVGAGRWILDPIDGTHGFARGVPIWASLIAYELDGVVQVGVASAPALGTRWWGARGMGAYRASTGGGNPSHAGERIYVSDVATIEKAQVLYGELRLARERWPGVLSIIEGAWRGRGFGDFWSHCLVAEGIAEVMLDPVVSPWDLGALIVIVEEAGGRLTDDTGLPGIDHGYAITSNGRVHDEVLARLRG